MTTIQHDPSIEQLARECCAILDQKKADNICCLNISGQSIIADYFIICSGRNQMLTRALFEELDDKMAQMGHTLIRAEGQRDAKWIVMDYGEIVVHIFHEPEREFYNLERLWDDGTNRLALDHMQEGEE